MAQIMQLTPYKMEEKMSIKSNKNHSTIKDNIKNITENLAINIGIYDDNNKLSEERIVPLGNYVHNPFPTNEEITMTTFLASNSLKR